MSSGTDEDHDVSAGEMDLTVLTKTLRWMIWAAALLFPLGFAWIQLSSFANGQVVETLSPNATRHIALAVYYLCWVQGSQFDIDIQESVYLPGRPARSRPTTAILFVALFCVIAAVLFWVSNDDRRFAVALLVFFAANIGGFAYILMVIRPFIRTTRRKYEQDGRRFSLLRLEFVEAYMCGTWQYVRFAVGLALIGLILSTTFSMPVRAALSAPVFWLLGPGTRLSALEDLLPSLSFALFILVIESWMWLMRWKVTAQTAVVDRMARHYTLTPRAPST